MNAWILDPSEHRLAKQPLLTNSGLIDGKMIKFVGKGGHQQVHQLPYPGFSHISIVRATQPLSKPGETVVSNVD